MIMNGFLIGVDRAPDGSVFCLQVFYRDGDRFKLVNSFFGEEAEELYSKLTEKKEE